MPSHPEAEAILRRVGALADAEIDLAETALVLASFDRPRVGLERYRDHLGDLARDLGTELERRGPPDDSEAGMAGRVGALKTVLIDRHGYRGDDLTYDDLQNTNLIRVIDRRRGLPVALAILFMHAARAQGWDVEGVNFPGHFLVRIQHAGARVIVDPFYGGCSRGAAELRELLKTIAGTGAELNAQHYAAIGNREILLRLQNNVKLRLLQKEQLDQAVQVLRRMLLFAPGHAPLWWEIGVLEAKLGNLRSATAALETFISVSPSDSQRHRAALMLQTFKGRLH